MAEKVKREKADREAAERAVQERLKRDLVEKFRHERAERQAAQLAVLKEILSKSFTSLKSTISKTIPLLRIAGFAVIIIALFWAGSLAVPKFISFIPTPKATTTVTQRLTTQLTSTNFPVIPTKTIEPTSTPINTPTRTLTPLPTSLGLIAFSCPNPGAHRTDDFEICIVSQDGSGFRRLTKNSWEDRFPGWSPKGDRLVFTGDYENQKYVIFSVGIDGNNLTMLTDDGSDDPSWSHTGDQIVYTCNGFVELCIMNSDGKNKRTIPQFTSSILISEPKWSPNGEWISFTNAETLHSSDIYIIKPDGSSLTRITNDGNSGFAFWAPDSKYLLFASMSANGTSQFFRTRIGESNSIEQLTNFSDNVRNLSWSPDGEKIVYTLDSKEDSNLYIYDLMDRNLTTLNINIEIKPTLPKWSSDGKTIAFTTGNSTAIYAVDSNGGNLRKIYDADVLFGVLVWSP